jgi:hypothetical protein
MTRLAVVLALACVLIPTAYAARLAYRTPEQAGAYLEHGLDRWAGVNLRSQKYKFHPAFCLPGARSKYERKHPHFPTRTTKTGETLFHTFACTLSAADRVWHVYLVAGPNGKFGVRADK